MRVPCLSSRWHNARLGLRPLAFHFAFCYIWGVQRVPSGFLYLGTRPFGDLEGLVHFYQHNDDLAVQCRLTYRVEVFGGNATGTHDSIIRTHDSRISTRCDTSWVALLLLRA